MSKKNIANSGLLALEELTLFRYNNTTGGNLLSFNARVAACFA